jgi:cytochrome c oxidase assembly protein subunit 15
VENRYLVSSCISLVLVYLVIIAGGIVRSTGSGMGCPDWPRCFGRWIPPTCTCELPANYQELYKTDSIHTVEFNPYKTWTEYVNRLIGVLVGFSIFFTFIFSIAFFKKDPLIFWISLLAFVLVGFQGWLGAVVVATHLATWMVTIHMLVALCIVACLIFVRYRALILTHKNQPNSINPSKKKLVNVLLIVLIFSFLTQIALGTQVREGIDEIALSMNYMYRDQWIGRLGLIFWIHRSFSIVVTLLTVWLMIVIARHLKSMPVIVRWMRWCTIFIGIEMISGIGMAYFSIPSFLQPFHLVGASVVFGIQFFLILAINNRRNHSSVYVG